MYAVIRPLYAVAPIKCLETDVSNQTRAVAGRAYRHKDYKQQRLGAPVY